MTLPAGSHGTASAGTRKRGGRSACAFRQRDVTVAARAVRKAGIDVGRIEIDPATGKIVVIVGKPAEAVESSGALDKWIAGRDAHQA